jgi:LysM repeat protein
MRTRLPTISVCLLVMVVIVVGVSGCERSAAPREPEATATAAPQATDTTAPSAPTVVSAVTAAPGGATPGETTPEATAPGTETQPTAQPPAEGETPVPQPTEAGDSEALPPADTAQPPVAPPEGSVVWHTVQPGETLSSIARRYGTTWQAIVQENNLSNPNQIYAGQKLAIPTSGGSSGGTASGCRIRHTVQPGEWVWQIARRYGVSPYDILAANGLSIQTANTIYPGTVLCIP